MICKNCKHYSTINDICNLYHFEVISVLSCVNFKKRPKTLTKKQRGIIITYIRKKSVRKSM